MNFSEALTKIKEGERLQRKGWNGKGQCVYMLKYGGHTVLDPCLAILTTKQRVQQGWFPSQADLFAEDWVVYEEEKGKNDE